MTEHSGIPAVQEHGFTNRIVKIFLESNLSLILKGCRPCRGRAGRSRQLRPPRLGTCPRLHET
jgi:hypothetical protein